MQLKLLKLSKGTHGFAIIHQLLVPNMAKWSHHCPLDATCPDSLAPSYTNLAAQRQVQWPRRRRGKKAEVFPPVTHSPLHASGHRDLGGVWTKCLHILKRTGPPAGSGHPGATGTSPPYPEGCSGGSAGQHSSHPGHIKQYPHFLLN